LEVVVLVALNDLVAAEGEHVGDPESVEQDQCSGSADVDRQILVVQAAPKLLGVVLGIGECSRFADLYGRDRDVPGGEPLADGPFQEVPG
jgi:hypothetical protein